VLSEQWVCARRSEAAADSDRTGKSGADATAQAKACRPSARRRPMIGREKRPQVATNARPHLRLNDAVLAGSGDNALADRPTGESRPLAGQRQVLDRAAETATGQDTTTRRPLVTTTGTIENTAPPSATGENGTAVSKGKNVETRLVAERTGDCTRRATR
jgi:hypothetical protein